MGKHFKEYLKKFVKDALDKANTGDIQISVTEVFEDTDGFEIMVRIAKDLRNADKELSKV